ncbi:tyrosinase family protein [Streptomyces cyaneofuscatus]|uniref:tyrosinase family protein n=1 Tax=Streptomyces griseus group TaxID=629295 RepID=UPI0036683A76
MTRSTDRRGVLKMAAAAGGVLALGLTVPARAAAAPGPVVTRPEVRTLTGQQWRDFVAAVHQLHSGNTTPNPYDRLVAVHYSNAPRAHGRPEFLPWHRVYLSRFEKSLQQINPSVVLPYWDWSRDAQAPERSPVLSSSYFGGLGRKSDGVVVDGAFGNWRCAVPSNHLLRRTTEAEIPAFGSAEVLDVIVSRPTSYDQLRRNLESKAHATVHMGIGGNNGDMSYMYAPNDPVFWVSEAFTDLLWAEWQQRHPTLARTYNGGRNAKPADLLTPFHVTVESTFNTRDLGYTYPRWSAESSA